MNRIPFRLGANLVWLIVFSVGVISASFIAYAGGFLFDDSYEVSVVVPEAGGLFPGQEITVLGSTVGRIVGVEVTAAGVLVTAKVDGDRSVPGTGRVQVLRRSAIGEQALDVQPSGPGWTPAQPGARLQPTEVVVPSSVPLLLERSVEFLTKIPPDALGSVVHELALGFGGKGDLLRDFGRDILELNTTLVAGIPEFERLIDTSENVLAVLDEHASELTSAFGNTADVLDSLADNQVNFETLLDTGVRTVVQADALVRNERANFECLMLDLTSFNTMVLGPSTAPGGLAGSYTSKLDELEQLLQRADWFYDGFDIVQQWDVETGTLWNRILLLSEEGRGALYVTKRATPATQPGAACETAAFGTGVNAVRQAQHQPADPTSPGILYAPLVEAQGPGQVDPPGPRSPLPATGGGMAALALVATIGGLTLGRKRS